MKRAENITVDPVLLEKLDFFVKGCQEIIQENWDRNKFTTPTDKLMVEIGNRYAKIINNHESRGQTSVYCFVDLLNGDILKAATWRAPAKHARGNLFDKSNGLSRMTPYGTSYLR
jgi:hypothetical protein